MSTTSKEELKRTSILKLGDSQTGEVTKIVSPNEFQVGLNDDEFKSSLTVKGTVIAEQGIKVSSDTDYVQAGSNISVTKNSDGSITIGSTGFPTNSSLTFGNGLVAGTYDGSQAASLSVRAMKNGGLAAVSSGVKIDASNATVAAPGLTNSLLFDDQGVIKSTTISNVLALGSPVVVAHPINFGTGIYDSGQGNTSWSNLTNATIAVNLKSNGGISVSGNELYVDPSNATTTNTIDTTNDFVLIYDASATDTRKVAVQTILAGTNTVGNPLTLGNGLAPYGTQFDGGASVTATVAATNSTINVSATGLSVAKVPNALVDGDGIQALSYDGSSSPSVAVDRNTAGGLNFNGSGKLQLDINNLSAGPGPALTDEIAVAFGSNDTQKIELTSLRSLITNNFISNTVWTDGGDKAKASGSISVDSTGLYADEIGTDVYFHVSGTVGPTSLPEKKSVFGGDVHFSGSIYSAGEIKSCVLTGSLTKLCDGSSYLIAGSGVEIVTGSSGAVTITATGGGGGGGSLDVVSGSTTVSSVDKLIVSKLGILQSLGSGDVAITGSIGVPEDGTYSDGLFTDFNESTPVGTAVDRFNEVLKGLAPGAAPSLDDMDCNNSGASAKLSFGPSQGIVGYSSVDPSFLTPSDSLADIDVNGTFSSTTSGNDIRVACFAGSTTIEGTLNEDIPADGVNYPANSFGNGDAGTLYLYVNDNTTEIHSVDLSSFGSGASLNANGSGFFDLSAADPGHFADSSTFSTFKHRSGSFRVDPADQRNGWNYARVKHTVGSSTTTCNYVEWVNDPDANALTSAGSALDSLSMTGIRKLSGARYNTAGSAEYRIRAENAYRNIYPTSNISFNGTNCSVSSQAFPVIDFSGGENETKTLHITGSATISADPILNGSITVSANIPAVLKSSLSSVGAQSISGILLYDLSNTSTVTSETFRRENYRIISGSYTDQASVTNGSNTWDSGKHMSGSNTGHSDGLLYYNSRLYAPVQGGVSGDFRNTADGGSITNGPSNNVNYSGITTGLRTFYRYFQNNSGGSKTNFSLAINGSGTIVNQATTLNTSNIHVLLKIPETPSAFTTGWMDLALPFQTGQNGNGAGCLDGSLDASLSATNGGTFGTQSVGSNEYIVVKIEADASWTGYISQMSITWV